MKVKIMLKVNKFKFIFFNFFFCIILYHLINKIIIKKVKKK